MRRPAGIPASSWFLWPPRRPLTYLKSGHYLFPRQPRPMRLNSTVSPLKDTDYVMYSFLSDDIEGPGGYCPGGYHPVVIGDTFNARYHIVHKLGHGTFSTIWLAYDDRSRRYVAVKICTSDTKSQKSHEAQILRDLSEGSFLEEPGWSMIPHVHDQFESQSPNGQHRCYVTSPAKCSLASIAETSPFEIDVARKLIVQLIQAVAYMHSRGFVHGDLHLGNILIRQPSTLDKLSIPEFYREYGEPRVEPIERYDNKPLDPGVPSYATEAIWLGKDARDITLAEAQIVLCDFGEAFSPSDPQKSKLGKDCCTARMLAPPEASFEPKTPMSLASDIWTLANAFWCLLGQTPLTYSFFAKRDDITAQRVGILGTLPLDWWERWEARDQFFDELGNFKACCGYEFSSLEGKFEKDVQECRERHGMSIFDEKEKKALLDMLRPMLAFRPENRPTANQVLQSDWMQNWGLSSNGLGRNQLVPWVPLTTSLLGL